MKNWTTEQVKQHWAIKPKHIFREPTRYIMFHGLLGRPASTIKRAVEMAEWNATLFLNNGHGHKPEDYEGDIYRLVKGAKPRTRKTIALYRATVVDNQVKLIKL